MTNRNAFWATIPSREGGTWLHRHSLQLFLLFNLLWQTVGAVVAYWYVWKNAWDTAGADTPATVFIVFFVAVYLTSLVADTYGAWLQVFATAHFIDEKSPTARSS